jgi:Raf kinase inhibitor-like YbhB/YbcL family protein
MAQYRRVLPASVAFALVLGLTSPRLASSDGAGVAMYTKGGAFTLPGGRTMAFALSTTAFPKDGEIPAKYTCSGTDVSPSLNWRDVPTGVQSFALIADDPDAPAGTWTHWLIWNIPANATALPEAVPKNEVLTDGARQGRNDFKRIGYGGPCPPPGKPHRYFFRLYALDAKPDVKAGAGRNELERAIKGHILSQTEFMGKYQR